MLRNSNEELMQYRELLAGRGIAGFDDCSDEIIAEMMRLDRAPLLLNTKQALLVRLSDSGPAVMIHLTAVETHVNRHQGRVVIRAVADPELIERATAQKT